MPAHDHHDPAPPQRNWWLIGAGLVLLVLAVALMILPDRPPSPGPPAGAAGTESVVVPPRPVRAEQLAVLPESTTHTTVSDAAPARIPPEGLSGRAAHPRGRVVLFDAPGGAPIASLPPQQIASDTWLPISDTAPGWVQVLLPSRPNGSAGWLYVADGKVATARSAHRVDIDVARRVLTLSHEHAPDRVWTVGVGGGETPTPTGTTFILASIQDTQPTFSPVVLPLGAHSDTHTRFAGGPGTVGLHTWPSSDVYGRAGSDGCVRVPPEALAVLSSEVPIGTPVTIH